MQNTHPKALLAKLPLDALRGFEASARALSFTLAASELSLTQSAISRQIKALEEVLGVALFRRMNRRIELTDAGQLLYRAAGSALRDLQSCIEEMVVSRTQPVVTVTTSLSFASLWLVPRLADFRRVHPGVDVRIAASDQIVNLEREGIDCAVRFMEPDSAPADAVSLGGDETFVVVSPRLMRDKSRPLKTPGDLRHHVLIDMHDPRGDVPWLSWALWRATLKIEHLKPAGVLTFSHYDQAVQAAIQGEGVAIGRRPLLAQALRNKKLVIPFGQRLAAARKYYFVVSRAARQRAPVQAFARWIEEEMRSEREQGLLTP
jgi:DNA-binding transcriptional LysR family regulator